MTDRFYPEEHIANIGDEILIEQGEILTFQVVQGTEEPFFAAGQATGFDVRTIAQPGELFMTKILIHGEREVAADEVKPDHIAISVRRSEEELPQSGFDRYWRECIKGGAFR